MTRHDDMQSKSSAARQPQSTSAYFRRKAWPVRIIGMVLLAAASPVILFLVVIVRLTSPGPGLYRQSRSGRNGATFLMYKIRTMYRDAESLSGPVWCQPGDSRITPVGKVLRLLHLDELPQLINVARGEMDLIGPRPERPEFVVKLAREIPNYHARLRILPGVTGLAQVNLPPDETIDCVRKKLVLDCAYIDEASFSLDIRILLCTFLRMIGIRHGQAVRLLGVKRQVHLVKKNRAAAHHPEQSKFGHSIYLPEITSVENGHEFVLVAPGVESGNGHYTADLENAAADYVSRRPK